ncbi:AraC family transcriptional regulator [Streptomyces sp. NPDC020707]|uniref:AraC family transcriptional regulator n=1 Tax=Streptomyces ortus TaxID=2867268 RepID=A0ABT3UZQ1_9ACTN|nr:MULTISPECIES: AraC family transcriptional regulator [Streptomyces]MCX4231523.1 AraC family transcriptional regulator [Streptomyces ortus]
MVADEGLRVGVRSYETRSLDESHVVIAQHYYDLRLDVRGRSEDFVTRLGVADLGALTVGDVSFGTEVTIGFAQPRVYHVTVPLTGRFRCRQGHGAPSCTVPERAVFLQPERGIEVDDWSADCRALTVKIDMAALHERLGALLGGPVRRPPSFETYIDVGQGAGRSWADLALWCLREKNPSNGLLGRPLIRSRIEQTLLEGLLLACGHSYRGALEAPVPAARPATVRRVMEAIEERPDEHYDAARLASLSQIGVRALQEAFRKHVGMSPTAYVTEVRLRRAHEQLLAADPATITVTEVAYRWGFAHLGRFAQRYRRRFGTSPGQTLRSG